MSGQVKLNQLVDILTRQNTISENDGSSRTEWVKSSPQVWAEVKPLRGQVLIAGQREESRADFMVTVFFRADLMPAETRVEWDDRQFTVVHFGESERGEPRQFTQLLVREERG